MELLMSQSYTRISNDGLNKSGKTCTSAQLALGIAKEYANGEPVHVFDSSDRWRTWKKLIFDVEKIPVVITYGESIVALQKALDAAFDGPCSVFVADDLTVPWMEGIQAFSNEYGTLTFDRRSQLMREWKEFVSGFRHGQFDSLACGRMGYVWENLEDPETGEMKLFQGDSKFNAGGGENFGYDCELELEMRRRKLKLLGLLRGKISVEHVCDVIGDAHNVLNGKQFVFKDWDGPYKPGMYRNVLDKFRPHIEFVRSLDSTEFSADSSEQLIVSGITARAAKESEKTKLLEEIDTGLETCFGSKQSTAGKMLRNLAVENLTGSMSWTRMADEKSVDDLRGYRNVISALRSRIAATDVPKDQKGLQEMLKLAIEDVFHLGKDKTLLEVRGELRRGPQPIVAAIEAGRADEIAGD
jgi:hypothetical protein